MTFPVNQGSAWPSQQGLVVLGSTGSIGTNTLDVIRNLPDRFQVVGLSAGSKWEMLFAQAAEFHPQWVHLADPKALEQADLSLLPAGVELVRNLDELHRRIQASEVKIVLAAIVGAAGLETTWTALEAGKKIALANKETLVVGGPLVMRLAQSRGGQILPVDSEHSAVFQAIQNHRSAVEKVVLTGSGGPFRGRSREQLQQVTVEQALNHPTWKMGPKITVDSATLMNKALEVIEARWLFGLEPSQIDVVIHPESLVHSFVEFVDGSILAQISPPDMRLPIQYALTYPERLAGPARKLAWSQLGDFHFARPDSETFPALRLGFEVAQQGGTSGAVLNAANEKAVELFLNGELPFLAIAEVCQKVLAHHNYNPNPGLAELWQQDRWAREEVLRWTRMNKK